MEAVVAVLTERVARGDVEAFELMKGCLTSGDAQ